MEKHNYVEKFVEDYLEEEFHKGDWTEENKFEKAVYKGYCDARRTFSGINIPSGDSVWSELSEKIKIKEFFVEGNVGNGQAFDRKHKDMCGELISFFDTEKDIYSRKVTYGQAQKIINMTFKYLFAYDYHAGHNLAPYKYCHMPLDKYTLSWYRRVRGNMQERMNGEYFLVKSGFSWSTKLGAGDEGYDKYRRIQKGIRLCLEENVLEQEFEIWYKEKQIEILSGIIKGMKIYEGNVEMAELKDTKEWLENKKERLESDVLELVRDSHQRDAG